MALSSGPPTPSRPIVCVYERVGVCAHSSHVDLVGIYRQHIIGREWHTDILYQDLIDYLLLSNSYYKVNLYVINKYSSSRHNEICHEDTIIIHTIQLLFKQKQIR